MMHARFGQKLKLPSTFSLKFQMLKMSLEEELLVLPAGEFFDSAGSPALAGLRRLMANQKAGSVSQNF